MKNRGQRLSGNIVDLHARRIYPGTVEWAGGRITRLTAEPGRRYTQFIPLGSDTPKLASAWLVDRV